MFNKSYKGATLLNNYTMVCIKLKSIKPFKMCEKNIYLIINLLYRGRNGLFTYCN